MDHSFAGGFGAVNYSAHSLLSIVVIVGWEWVPFAVLILLQALRSLNPEQVGSRPP